MFLFLFAFMSFAILGSSMILAEEGDNNLDDSNTETTDNSDSGESSIENVETTSDDESKVETETKVDRERLKEIAKKRLEERREKMRENLKKEFRENGAIVKVEREVEVQDDGSVKITIKRTIIDANGVERKIVIKIVEKDGERKVKIEGEENVPELETELEIEDDFDGNDSDLETTTSDGERHKIRVLPDEARRKILARLMANNISAIELREIKERNIPRVVYNIETNKHGRFLGVFKLAMKVEGQVDPDTGEVLNVNKPWWAILVAGEDDAEEGFVDGETEEDITGTFLENTTSNESDIAT